MKKYPACYCTHRAIDGMLDLVRERDVKPGDVASVTVTLSENFATILRNHLPQTGLAAKFSIEFAMACALVARRVGLAELTDDFVRRPDVQALMKLVSVQISTEPDPGYPGAALADQVTIGLTGGGTLEGERGAPRARPHRQSADRAGPVYQVRGLPDRRPFRRAAAGDVRAAEGHGARQRPLPGRIALIGHAAAAVEQMS